MAASITVPTAGAGSPPPPPIFPSLHTHTYVYVDPGKVAERAHSAGVCYTCNIDLGCHVVALRVLIQMSLVQVEGSCSVAHTEAQLGRVMWGW